MTTISSGGVLLVNKEVVFLGHAYVALNIVIWPSFANEIRNGFKSGKRSSTKALQLNN